VQLGLGSESARTVAMSELASRGGTAR
jgi:hypothetical protein